MREEFHRQVALLVRTIPLIAEEPCFALKGGTAINLFVRDLPRLSVDIDLTYLPVHDREVSLDAIDEALRRIARRIETGIPRARVVLGRGSEQRVTHLDAHLASAQVKIEVTPVLRGCVFDPELRPVTAAVEETFGFAEAWVVSFADLYAGKLVAALDRQHPRDLFDVRILLAHEGIDDALRTAFAVYVVSHGRPMAELLEPTRKDLAFEFARTFEGMTDEPVSIEQLVETREQLIRQVVGEMPDPHREFLLSIERCDPDWSLLGIDGVDRLPAVRWRLHNLQSISPAKRQREVDRLRSVLLGT